MVEQLRTTAQKLGLPFGKGRIRTYNSRLAQELGLWAEEMGKGTEFHMAAFHGYFAEGLNLAKIPILLELADKAGLPKEEAEAVLTDRSYRDQVDRDWADSRFKAINAVPTFVMGRHKLVGAQSYDALVELINQYRSTE